MKVRSGYALSMLLITIVVSVVLTAAVARVAVWSIRSVRAAQASARYEIVSSSVWHQLITDCLCASTQRTDWRHDGLTWIFKTPTQWVCWFIHEGALYRRYGTFNGEHGRWSKYQTERVLSPVSTLQIDTQFENHYVSQVALKLIMKEGDHAYTYQTTLY